ncbi:MAG: DUF4386 family protein [Candidatus Heimdallarchaeota archaeon]|nr:MAG: DUF4386 family protein [Candidatus Heimdallarchaeota archaeon]
MEQAIKDEEQTKKSIYTVGGIAALIAALLFRKNIGSEFVMYREFGIIDWGPSPTPVTAEEWFTLLQDNVLLGLTLLDFFDIINYCLVSLVFITLYYVLRSTNEDYMTIALISGLIGVAVYFASNQAFSLLSLSNQYAAASIGQKATILTAGEALLAIHNPGSVYQGTGIYLSHFLVSLSGLIIAIVMFQSSIFSKPTAYAGIIANGFVMGHFILLIIAPQMTFLPYLIASPALLIWYVLISRKLYEFNSVKMEKGLLPRVIIVTAFVIYILIPFLLIFL